MFRMYRHVRGDMCSDELSLGLPWKFPCDYVGASATVYLIFKLRTSTELAHS